MRPDRRAVLAGLAGAILGPTPLLAAPATEPRTASVRQTVSPGRTLAIYLAVPGRGRGRRPGVLVLHDADGLDAQARAAARVMARLGYVGCAPDLLSRLLGTPADPAAARIMVAWIDPAEALDDAIATMQWLGRNPPGERVLTGRVAAIGFGWGAALVERLAAAQPAALAAGILVGGSPGAGSPDGTPPLLRLDAFDPASDRVATFLAEHLR